jgi:hypothetical protein
MRTEPEEIIANTVKDACLAAMPFDLESAKALAEDLKTNTSIENLDLGLCNLTDDEFAVIVESLVSRKTDLNTLNLNYNDMTNRSFEAFQSLIMNGKVKTITIFKCDNLIDDAVFMEKLQGCALKKNVNISTQNPLQLQQKYKLFPPKDIETQKTDVEERKEHPVEFERKSPGTPL